MPFKVVTTGRDNRGVSKTWINERFAYRIGRVVLQKWKRVPALLLAAMAFDFGWKTELLESELKKYSNACGYYLWGMCIHPECTASHDQDTRMLLKTYYEQRVREYARSANVNEWQGDD